MKTATLLPILALVATSLTGYAQALLPLDKSQPDRKSEIIEFSAPEPAFDTVSNISRAIIDPVGHVSQPDVDGGNASAADEAVGDTTVSKLREGTRDQAARTADLPTFSAIEQPWVGNPNGNPTTGPIFEGIGPINPGPTNPVTDVKATGKKTLVKAYPNPAVGFFLITSPGLIQQLDIFSLEGRLVQQATPGRNEHRVEGLQPGAYMVRVQTQDGISTERVIVN